MKKIIDRDVYNRPTKISYFDGGGKLLYSETLEFESAISNRMDSLTHVWKRVPSIGDTTRAFKYDYDFSGRLTNVHGELNAEYDFDNLGRITKKIEDTNSVGYAYTKPTYRPSSFNVNGGSPSGSAEYLKFDAAGNVWFDKHNAVLYKNDVNGMILKAYKFAKLPENVTIDSMNTNSNMLNTAEFVADMAYDESGSRVWYAVNRDGYSYAEATIPGVGVYEQNSKQREFVLKRMDLVAGGYRSENGDAYFPITDAQGNVRGYVTKSGLQSAYDYYPYGTEITISGGVVNDGDKRWQGKEFDGEHGKYYFGARYFDPFFAMWASPDPANQFANPYTYGGDPINYVDPNGEFSIGAILSATVGIIKEAVKQKEDWWRVNRYDWGSIGNSAAAGAYIDLNGGPAGAAENTTFFAFVGRVIDPQNKDRMGTVTDYISGGYLVDWHGHFIGINNAQYGGTMDWYNGHVVYSDGLAGALMPDGSGAEFGGHALFVQDRNDKNVVAHELRHVQQMEKHGFRFEFMYDYLKNNGWSPTPYVSEYEFNPYENDARYAQFLKESKRIDIYGNKIGDWTHEEVAPKFREWMVRNGYTSFAPGGANQDWIWEEGNGTGHDF